MFTQFHRRIDSIAICAAILSLSATWAQAPPLPLSAPVPASRLIPRALLFGNPDKVDAGISPDGTQISFLAPVDGAMNIWVAPFGKLEEARQVTKLKDRGVGDYFWTFNPKYMLYLQDHDGDENDHIYRVDVATGEVKDLTPFPNVKAGIAATSHKLPDEILIGMNARDVRYQDIYRVNLVTAESRRVLKNTKYLEVLADDDLKLRVGVTVDGPEGLDAGSTPETRRFRVARRPAKGSIVDPGLAAFDGTGEYVYTLTDYGTDWTSLVKIHFKKGDTTRVADGTISDICGAVMSPVTKDIQAVWEYYTRQRWQIVDNAVYDDFTQLLKSLGGEFFINDRTLDDRYWIVGQYTDTSPTDYYVFDRKNKTVTLLFHSRPKLSASALAPMYPQIVSARDGLKMVSYLTIPVESDPDRNGRPNKPLPMVLWVHGGPTSRDMWGYDPIHQWLANRGYAVLSVNFRGSSGFGKKYEDAGTKEWGAKMQADLDDAMDWAVKEGIADPKRVAITGASYGGYAALCGLAFTPERYACGVDICGPSNLITMMKENQAPYFMVDLDAFKEEVGDPDSKRGREFLRSRSPLTKAADVTRPLLVAQGTNDPRVYKAESDQFVTALKGKSLPLTYLVYPNEGHGFHRPENMMSFYGAMEAFLAKHIGGAAEPMGGDMKASSVQVVTGAREIPGLTPAIETPTSG